MHWPHWGRVVSMHFAARSMENKVMKYESILRRSAQIPIDVRYLLHAPLLAQESKCPRVSLLCSSMMNHRRQGQVLELLDFSSFEFRDVTQLSPSVSDGQRWVLIMLCGIACGNFIWNTIGP